MKVPQNFLSNSIRSVFHLDLRAIALMRILLALVIFADLIIRSWDIKAFYTGKGTLPLQVLFDYLWHPFHFSIHNAVDSEILINILFAINFACVFCLLIGYKTRLFTVLVWIFLVSLHNRNPLITQAGDNLIRMIVFWGIFLPWGYKYSLDSFKNAFSVNENTYESFASIAYVCQIAFLYYFSALLKNSPEWHTDLTAIYYALSLDQLTTPLAQLIYPFPEVLKAMTASVYYIELLLPFLLFIPFFNGWFRMIIIFTIIALQTGIYATMNVGLFSVTSIVIMFGLIPTNFLNYLEKKYARFYGNLINKVNSVSLKEPLFQSKVKKGFPLPHPVMEILVAFSLFLVLSFNMQSIGQNILPVSAQSIGEFFKLNQHWGMFAPAVYKNDGWFIYEANTENDEKIDLLKNGKEVNFNKPIRVTEVVKSDRWRKYGENILMIEKAHFRPYLCSFLLEDWNLKHPKNQITTLNIWYMHELTLPDYKTAPIEKWEICSCNTP